MKRTYAFILAGSLLAATSLTGCGTENTTGVETETHETEDMNNGTMMEEDNTMMEEDTTMMDNTAGDTASTMGNTGATTGH